MKGPISEPTPNGAPRELARPPLGCQFGVLRFCRVETSKVLCSQFERNGMVMTSSRIAADPAVMMGKPCIKGTRLTVELILRRLGASRSFADVLEAYPQLTAEDLRAALVFAADYLKDETVLAVE
jgi:uncharacterized protein (DUF433 family)